jgi:sulfur-oxidizing protein SoxY
MSNMPPETKDGKTDAPLRRDFLLGAGRATVAMIALAATGMLRPARVIAAPAEWQRTAFTATTLADALKSHGAANSTEHREIVLNAPDVAENGAQVVVEVTSNLPDSESISIFAEKNPMPLAAFVRFSSGALPHLRIPLKLSETMHIRATVRTRDGKYWHARKEVKVTLGGCGG